MTAASTDYTDLITSEHADKPHFFAVVELVGQFAADERNTLGAMPADFDVDAAVGAQLDTLALWVGVNRIVTVIPSDAYPTPADPYQVSLSDAVLRRLVKARVIANRWDGTPEMTAEILAAFYGPDTFAAVLDNQDMSIALYITGLTPTAAEAAVFSQFLLPVRPAGVRVADTVIPPAPGGPLFGLSISNDFIDGPSVGSFGVPF